MLYYIFSHPISCKDWKNSDSPRPFYDHVTDHAHASLTTQAAF